MALSAVDFEYVCRMVRADSAVALGVDKQYLVESRLAPLAAGENLLSVSDLLRRVRSDRPALRRQVVEAMLTNETLFFRDMHPFDALRDHIIPERLAANCGRLSMWSAAASTGQEAYSLAMLLRDHFPDADQASILATDLSATMVERGAAGRFSHAEINRGLPASLLVRHFDRVGREWSLHDDVRRLVTWRQMNMVGPLRNVPAMDIVLLRNVLVYFDAPTRAAVIAELAQIMRPGGYLLLGGSEITPYAHPGFQRVAVGRSIFYRVTEQRRSRVRDQR